MNGLNCFYLSNHKEITPYMRSVLIDWIMEVCFEYSLKRHTFYSAINILERYLSVKSNIPK